MTHDGAFVIEIGNVTNPTRNRRFTESPFFVSDGLEVWGEPVRASPPAVAWRFKLHDCDDTSFSEAI